MLWACPGDFTCANGVKTGNSHFLQKQIPFEDALIQTCTSTPPTDNAKVIHGCFLVVSNAHFLKFYCEAPAKLSPPRAAPVWRWKQPTARFAPLQTAVLTIAAKVPSDFGISSLKQFYFGNTAFHVQKAMPHFEFRELYKISSDFLLAVMKIFSELPYSMPISMKR